MEFTHDLQLACHTETKARQVKKFANLKEQQGRAASTPSGVLQIKHGQM